MKRLITTVAVLLLALISVPVTAQVESAHAQASAAAAIIHNPHAANAQTSATAAATFGAVINEAAAHGHYIAWLTRCDPTCHEVWRDNVENVVTTVGRNLALDTYLAGSAYTVTGPFMGLISSVSYTTGPVAADTMASHGGWTEAGATNAPTYTAPRKTLAWSAASGASKATSSAASFSFTGSGTVKGCFIVYGSGALSTIDNTAGTIYSAGLFTGGDKVVASGDTLNITYTASMLLLFAVRRRRRMIRSIEERLAA